MNELSTMKLKNVLVQKKTLNLKINWFIIKKKRKNNTSKAHLKEVPESKIASLDYKIIKEAQ
jgi:hypothetical protein